MWFLGGNDRSAAISPSDSKMAYGVASALGIRVSAIESLPYAVDPGQLNGERNLEILWASMSSRIPVRRFLIFASLAASALVLSRDRHVPGELIFWSLAVPMAFLQTESCRRKPPPPDLPPPRPSGSANTIEHLGPCKNIKATRPSRFMRRIPSISVKRGK